MPYISLNKANSNHKTRDANGQATSRYSRYETGMIDGDNRQLMAVIADSAGFDGMGFNAAIGSSDDHWHVANTFDSNRRYIDTMVIGGAFDAMHAKQVADSQLHHLGADNCVVMVNPQFDSLNAGKPDTWSIDAIDKLLNNRSQDRGFLPVITAQELNAEAARVTFDEVQWDNMSGLISHNGNDSALFLDLVRADSHKQLLEPLNITRELELLGAEEHTFDALMDKKLRLTLLTDRLFNAMSRAGDADLSVTGVTETKPFKRQGVTNIAYIFDLSDGQKLSIWFHNPDSTPAMLKPDDIMISWKWMLNKRDMTAVLSPKQGDNVQLPVLAARIMRVARKNSKKFKDSQARAAVLEQELLDAQALVERKQGEIDQLDTDISGLNADIDAAMAAQKEADVPPQKSAKEIDTQQRVLRSQFAEVTEFYKNNGAEPNLYADDFMEKALAKRLQSIRANPEFVEYLASFDTYNLLNDEEAPAIISTATNTETAPFDFGDPIVWRSNGNELRGTFKTYNATNHSIAMDTDDGQMNAPANEVFIDHEASAPVDTAPTANFKVGDRVVWRNEFGEIKGTFRGQVNENIIFISDNDGQMSANAKEIFADDSAAADDSDDSSEAVYTKADVVDEKVYKTMGAAKANMTKNQLDKRRFEIVEIIGGGFGIKGNPLDRAVLRPQIFALIDQGVAAYPDPENVTMITNRSGFDVLGKIVDLADARIEELESENIITRAEIKAAIHAHIQEAPAVDEAPAAPVVETDADVIPEKLNQVESLFELSKLAPKAGEAIKSDDPDAIEKLEAKLAYHQARAAMMRDANKHLRSGNDDALIAMGFKDKTIAALKEPDYAGRKGFVDYQMSNNNGEIGRVKKRLKGLYSERDANTPTSYPPVEYDEGMNDYIAFKDASKKDKWYARHDNSVGDWTVRVDDEYTRGFGEDKITVLDNAEQVISHFPAFEGLIELINDTADAKARAKAEAEQNTPAANNEFELNASDLKAYEKGVAAYSSDAIDRYLPKIAEAKAKLDAAGAQYLSESEYQAAINDGDMGGLSADSQRASLNESKERLAGLRDKKVKPSDIVGTGYKDARSVAFTWLASNIAGLEASLNGDPSGFNDSVNLGNYSGYLNKQVKGLNNDDAEPKVMGLTTERVQAENNTRNAADVKLQAERMGWKVLDTQVASKSFKVPKYASTNSEYEGLFGKTSLDNVIVMVAEDTTGAPFVSAWAAGKYNFYNRLGEYDIEAATGLKEYILKHFNDMNLGGTSTTPAGKEDLDDLFSTRMDGTGAASKRVLKGKTNKAKTAKGTSIASEFALVDAKFLIASHNAAGTKNPDYPQDLQPRDRARESSIAWVQKTSKALDPESLGRTSRVDTGAPIVGDDLIVESGNGRTIAIKMAYKNGDAKAYREWLIENARMFGFTEQQVESYKQPVLVRMRTTDVNRAEFAVEANQDDKLSFTASERAKADSKRISGGMLELFAPAANGDINAAANRPFVKQFLASLGATEAAQYTDSNGYPTQALVARIKSAIFSKAYDDDRLLEMMADQTKPDLQNMLNALTMAAPSFVAAQAVNPSDAQDLASQVIDGVEKSINDEVKAAIVDASNMIMSANQNNQDVKEYVLQLGLFDEIDDATSELAVFLAANARSAKKMADYFNAMAKYIEQDAAKRLTLDIFDDPKPISMADVIAYANQTTTEVETPMTQDMFAEPAAPVVDPAVIEQQPVPTAAPAAGLASDELDAKVADFESTVNGVDFNPADFNAEAFIALVSAAEGNAALTTRIQAISATYQQKLIAASMAAMTALAGGA